jgi:hypothetical protein
MERMGLAWPVCHHHGRDKYEAAEEVCHRAPHTVVGFVRLLLTKSAGSLKRFAGDGLAPLRMCRPAHKERAAPFPERRLNRHLSGVAAPALA